MPIPKLILATAAFCITACSFNLGDENEEDGVADMQETETSAPDVDVDTDSGEPCALTSCSDACVDLKSSVEHCGACGNACNGGVCVEGVCAMRVFITSTAYTGDLGGIEGADSKCARHASDAGLEGTWMAWLSTTVSAPDTRFPTHHDGPYVLAHAHTRIADDWAQLTEVNTPILAAIDRDENDDRVPSSSGSCDDVVWSGVKANGSPTGSNACPSGSGPWTVAEAFYGPVGNPFRLSRVWTESEDCPCETLARLYCFEQ